MAFEVEMLAGIAPAQLDLDQTRLLRYSLNISSYVTMDPLSIGAAAASITVSSMKVLVDQHQRTSHC